MSNAPEYNIDLQSFWRDPYPDLKRMRAEAPVAFVPQLGATLITRRNDIFVSEKNVAVFSSLQPDGLMTRLMGENMMRKDGEDHMVERRALYPCFSPRAVKDVWRSQFEEAAARALGRLDGNSTADLVQDYAMEVSAEALKSITGLTNMDWREMDRVSQGMIDGCANYAGDEAVEKNCHDCTRSIDDHISQRLREIDKTPDSSMLSVQLQAGLSDKQMRANIKLAISGGQNEPRDAIAGITWALLAHPEWLDAVKVDEISWLQVFEEYVRWISPIGMSPRLIAKEHEIHGVTLEPGDRLFLMFGSGNRDEEVFARPDVFDPTQDCSGSLAFGAGPHFCAGARASRCLLAEVALPMLFERFPSMKLLDKEPSFGGWAFRGPLKLPLRLH